MQRGGLSQVVMVNPVFLLLRTPRPLFSQSSVRDATFSCFRGSTSNLENFACKGFRIIMYIRRDIYRIRENCFHEILKIANSQKFIDISVCTSAAYRGEQFVDAFSTTIYMTVHTSAVYTCTSAAYRFPLMTAVYKICYEKEQPQDLVKMLAKL